MALLEYNPENCFSAGRRGHPKLSVTKSGNFTISKDLQQLLGTSDEKKQIKFFQDDEDEMTWYICAVEKGGFELSATGKEYKDGSRALNFSNITLLRFILSSCEVAEKGFVIPVSDEGVEIEDTGMAYLLITAALKS